jgi:hypothetical protein
MRLIGEQDAVRRRGGDLAEIMVTVTYDGLRLRRGER